MNSVGAHEVPSTWGFSTERDVPQPRVGEICRKVSFWRTIVLRPLAALRPTTASEMKAIPL